MRISFGREICGNLNAAEEREWLVTNGIGGYASGTVAGSLTRCYHGLLVAALKPPLERTLLLTKIDDIVCYDDSIYCLCANRWAGGTLSPKGHCHIESFHLDGTIPVWHFAFGDALLEKRIWMDEGANTTYIRYQLRRGSRSLKLALKAIINYRDHHSRTNAGDWQMNVESVPNGVRIVAFDKAVPFYLLTDRASAFPVREWYCGYELAIERDRGLDHLDDNLHCATFDATIEAGDTLTFVASTEANPDLDGTSRLGIRKAKEQKLLTLWQNARPQIARNAPEWIEQLILSADQFIVDRPLADTPDGKSIIAGYHWFSDWGRDTMIVLPGLTLATAREDIARSIILTFAHYVNKGLLPNRFPDDAAPLTENDYNTVDATLWYFEAIRAYHAVTGDDELLNKIFPILVEIVDWHIRGTRYKIQMDSKDGLLYAGVEGVQLTWMDAKVDGWVVTPRIGKPVEVNALWYNALRVMSEFARRLGQPSERYDAIAELTLKGFQRFWNETEGYCFDVLDTPTGDDASLRSNQIFAVSLPNSPLTPARQRSVVEVCARFLLTSHGLRSLAPQEPHYRARYTGDLWQRDGAYHQGTVWGWSIGPFISAHLRVFQDKATAREILEPFSNHLHTAGVGNISEIFDGDAPMQPKGCIAQAWSVSEVLKAWLAINDIWL